MKTIFDIFRFEGSIKVNKYVSEECFDAGATIVLTLTGEWSLCPVQVKCQLRITFVNGHAHNKISHDQSIC